MTLALLISILLGGSCKFEEIPGPSRITATHQLGSTEIRTTFHTFPGSSLLYFNMHDDENTAVEAALRVLSRTGGKLLELDHSGQRLIHFELRGEEYAVDPNRIFTEQGVQDTLARHSRFDPDAFEAVRQFAREILEKYEVMTQPVIVTLHNNQEDGYAASSYMEGGSYEEDAESVHISEGHDPDDFFFVTTEPLFEFFKQSGWNVVLQDNGRATDDGSLSVLAGEKGVPYINIEAQHGHLAAQEAMIFEVQQYITQSVD